MIAHPFHQILQAIRRYDLRYQLARKLALPSGPLEEHHHHACKFQCEPATQVLLHQCQRKVHSGCYSSRCVNLAILCPETVGLDVDLWKIDMELATEGPVGRCAPSVEDTEFGQNHRPGAYGSDPSTLSCQ